MLRAVGINNEEFIEELLRQRNIRGIPPTAKYSMTDSEIQKDLNMVLKKLSSTSAKLQREISVKSVRLTPKKFIRMALVLGLYIILLPVCVYHIVELGYEENATEKVLKGMQVLGGTQNDMAVVLEEMAWTVNFYLTEDEIKLSETLTTVHKHSDSKFGRNIELKPDCNFENERWKMENKVFDVIACIRTKILSQDGNIPDVLLKYLSVSDMFYQVFMKHLLQIETVDTFIPYVSIDKLAKLSRHYLAVVSFSLFRCNNTKYTDLADHEAYLAQSILDSPFADKVLVQIRDKVHSGLRLVKTLRKNQQCNISLTSRNIEKTLFVTDEIIFKAKSVLTSIETSVMNTIRYVKSVKILFSILLIAMSILLFISLLKIFRKEKVLMVQMATLENLKESYKNQSNETETCLGYYVPRDLFGCIPQENRITIVMEGKSKLQSKRGFSENLSIYPKKKDERTQSLFHSLSDWTKKLIQNKKKAGKYSCPENMVSLSRNMTSTSLQKKTVTVFKSDIAKFNRLLNYCTPHQITNIVTALMEIFDDRIGFYNVYVLNRATDSYTVVSGITEKQKNSHATEIANMALDIMNVCSDLEIERVPDCKLRIRIGIHTGICFETLSGPIKPRYCIYGEILTVVNQLQKTAIPNRIHLSDSAYNCLRKNMMYNIQKKGKTDLKNGKSEMTYWLLGRRVSMCYTTEEARRKISQFSRNLTPVELEMRAVYDYDSEEKGYIPTRPWMMHRYSLESASEVSNSSSYIRKLSSSQSNITLHENFSRRHTNEILSDTNEIFHESLEDSV